MHLPTQAIPFPFPSPRSMPHITNYEALKSASKGRKNTKNLRPLQRQLPSLITRNLLLYSATMNNKIQISLYDATHKRLNDDENESFRPATLTLPYHKTRKNKAA